MNQDGEPTTLGMIYESVSSNGDKIDNMSTAQTTLISEMKHLRKEHDELRGDFRHHVNNRDKHYKPNHSETLQERLIRKKGEVAVITVGGGSLGVVLLKVIELVLSKLGGA